MKAFFFPFNSANLNDKILEKRKELKSMQLSRKGYSPLDLYCTLFCFEQ